MPYGLILLVAAVVLAVRYARLDRASRRSKWLVGCGALASVVAFVCLPGWQLAAVLVQLGVSVYVIVYMTMTAQSSEPDRAWPGKKRKAAKPGAAADPRRHTGSGEV